MMAGPSRGVILAVDTASPTISLVVARGEEIVALHDGEQRKASRRLLPMLQEALDQGGWKRQDLFEVRLVLGPGSFTGLRIGLSLALGLHQSLGVTVLAVPAFALLARSLAEAEVGSHGRTAVHALGDDWFVQSWDRLPRLEPASGIERRSVLDLAGEDSPIAVSGSERLLSALGDDAAVHDAGLLAPLLLRLEARHLRMLEEGDYEPLYLAPPPTQRGES